MPIQFHESPPPRNPALIIRGGGSSGAFRIVRSRGSSDPRSVGSKDPTPRTLVFRRPVAALGAELLLDRPHFDCAQAGGRPGGRNAQGLVRIGRFDQEIAAKLFLGLGKRSVGNDGRPLLTRTVDAVVALWSGRVSSTCPCDRSPSTSSSVSCRSRVPLWRRQRIQHRLFLVSQAQKLHVSSTGITQPALSAPFCPRGIGLPNARQVAPTSAARRGRRRALGPVRIEKPPTRYQSR